MKRRIVVTTLCLLAWSGTATAWESDIHYGLTRWLAVRAGFTEDAAETLAFSNESLDHGIRAAPLMIGVYACRGDYGAARNVRDNHFPTFADVPNPPERREVVAGSGAAQKRARDEARRKIDAAFSNAQSDSLKNFGEGLHALQDSWSHKGIPDVPPRYCDRNLTWAHPSERGGWASHAADLTYLWVGETMSAAEATYKLMLEYLKTNPWAASNNAPAAWPTLQEHIVRFAAAETKTDKWRWFQSHGFKASGFLNGITSSDGSSSFLTALLERTFATPPDVIAKAQVPDDVRTFFKGFITLWMTSDNIDELVKRTDPGWLSELMGLNEFGDRALIARTVLMAWRVRDHGLVNSLGHTSPTADKAVIGKVKRTTEEPKALFQKLAKLTQDSKALIRYDSLEKATIQFGKENFIVVPIEDGRYAAFVQFRHTPHDMVVLEVARVSGDWRVISLKWMIDH
jgi:hypothetical protein